MDAREQAKDLIDAFGGDAAAKALLQVLERRMLGDPDGEYLWLAILSAVLELQRPDPGPRRTLH